MISVTGTGCTWAGGVAAAAAAAASAPAGAFCADCAASGASAAGAAAAAAARGTASGTSSSSELLIARLRCCLCNRADPEMQVQMRNCNLHRPCCRRCGCRPVVMQHCWLVAVRRPRVVIVTAGSRHQAAIPQAAMAIVRNHWPDASQHLLLWREHPGARAAAAVRPWSESRSPPHTRLPNDTSCATKCFT